MPSLKSLVCLALVTTAAPAAEPKPMAVPQPFTLQASVEGVTEYRLPNGLKVLLVPDPSKPSVTVNLTVFAGSRQENYGEHVLAHLFEHMLFKRTRRIASIKDELTKLGSMANGTTWFDRTNFYETFPADDTRLARVIELEAERLRNAVISREELGTEMTVVRNELEMGENDPEASTLKRLMSAAYLWHNYGNVTIGPRSDIEHVPNERLLAWYDTYYQPDNAMLIVAGKFDEPKVLRQIAATFGRLPRPKRTLVATYTEEPTQDGEGSVTVRRVGGVPLVLVGYHIPAGTDPDYAAIDVLSSVLGSSPSGRLYSALVDSKKAARVGCESYQLKEPGYLSCFAQLNVTGSTGPAKDAIVAAIEQLKAPTREEVDRAKAELLKQVDLVLNSSDRVGIFLSEFAAMGDWRMLFIHRDRIAAVSPETIASVAARYFKAANRTLGEYVPTEKPDRADIPALVDLAPLLAEYKGKAAVAEGEPFEATPKNIDARTKRLTLPGGTQLALLSKRTRGETVQLSIRLQYGTEKSLLKQGPAGELAAKMLLRGTKTKTRQQVQDALDALKAEVEIKPGPQAVTVKLEVRRPQLAATLTLLGECLTSPAFDPKELEALRQELLAEAEQAKDDPMDVGFRGLQRMMSPFPKGHPLYVSSWPEAIAELSAATLQQIRDFHARFYGGQAGLVAAVGDFDEKELTNQVTSMLDGWKAKEPFVRVLVPSLDRESSRSSLELHDKPMAFLGLGTTVKLKDSDADYPSMLVANYLLGGGFLSGRVPQRLREKEGLSYGAGTFLDVTPFDDSGVVLGYAIYAPENLERVERGFLEEIQRAAASGFNAAELAMAKEGLLRERETARAEDAELAKLLVSQLDATRTMAFEAHLDERVKALTAQDVSAAFKKYIDPNKLSLLRVGDFKKVQPLQ